MGKLGENVFAKFSRQRSNDLFSEDHPNMGKQVLEPFASEPFFKVFPLVRVLGVLLRGNLANDLGLENIGDREI
jgi:hypothetical protein